MDFLFLFIGLADFARLEQGARLECVRGGIRSLSCLLICSFFLDFLGWLASFFRKETRKPEQNNLIKLVLPNILHLKLPSLLD